KDWDSRSRETFGEYLQRNGFPCARGARNQAMPVAVLCEHPDWLFALADEDVVHGAPPISALIYFLIASDARTAATGARAPDRPERSSSPVQPLILPNQQSLGAHHAFGVGAFGGFLKGRDGHPAQFPEALLGFFAIVIVVIGQLLDELAHL